MTLIDLMLGSTDRVFRRSLRACLQQEADIRVLAHTGDPDRLEVLAATWFPALIVLDARLVQDSPELLNHLTAVKSAPRILLCADDLSAPNVLTAVEHGVQGCVLRHAEPDTWLRAIRAIHAGDTWIPRWLMAEALADLKQLLPAGLPASLNLERLTERQQEIVRWVAQGMSNKEIGHRLGISPTTVKTHLRNISERIGVNGRQRIVIHTSRHNAAA